MALVEQIPGILDVVMVWGDNLMLPLDIDPVHLTTRTGDFDLTDHGLYAAIFEETRAISPWNPSGEAVNGKRICEFDLELVDAHAGRVALSLRGPTSQVFVVGSPYRWHLTVQYPNQFTRTLVSGSFKVISP